MYDDDDDDGPSVELTNDERHSAATAAAFHFPTIHPYLLSVIFFGSPYILLSSSQAPSTEDSVERDLAEQLRPEWEEAEIKGTSFA